MSVAGGLQHHRSIEYAIALDDNRHLDAAVDELSMES